MTGPGSWPRIKAADIVLFCTPIWWGGRSSLMQRVIERLDALDEEYSATGRSAIKGKVAGIVITGSEDGALSVMGSIMMVLSFMGFTLPPECCAYWVGEVGQPVAQDREKRLRNMATMHMAKGLAQSVVYHARLLKANPPVATGSADCCAMHAGWWPAPDAEEQRPEQRRTLDPRRDDHRFGDDVRRHDRHQRSACRRSRPIFTPRSPTCSG
jgi:multimeric flavodoxin WrbA